jgi:hypothetical protein
LPRSTNTSSAPICRRPNANFLCALFCRHHGAGRPPSPRTDHATFRLVKAARGPFSAPCRNILAPRIARTSRLCMADLHRHRHCGPEPDAPRTHQRRRLCRLRSGRHKEQRMSPSRAAARPSIIQRQPRSVPGCQEKWLDRRIGRCSGRSESVRSPSTASREPRRLLSSTPFQSPSG